MIDTGSGPPLVFVPGIQGRWEWMRPSIVALARSFRVLSFTLAGERTSRHPFDPALGFDNFVAQIDRVLAEAGVESAVVCGVSYGGLIAMRYAGLRPRRVRTLVLVSALPPGYVPERRVRFYSRSPRLLLPVFCVDAIRRSRAEIRIAVPDWRERLHFSAAQARRILTAPVSPRVMAERVRLLSNVDFETTAARVTAPSLVVTGERGLDRVVPVEQTLRYVDLLPQAEVATLRRTGHLGTVTRPDEFAAIVDTFVRKNAPGALRIARRVAG